MKKYPVLLMLFFILTTILFTGCNEKEDIVGDENTFQCLKPAELDQLELDFKLKQLALSNYLDESEFVFLNQSSTTQRGIFTNEGHKMRLEYEGLRDQYINAALNDCKKSNGSTIDYASIAFLKGDDLINYEIHPEYFLDLPIHKKTRWVFEEPDIQTGETTDYLEFEYHDIIDNLSITTVIRAWHVGTDENQWQWLANEQNFKIVSFEDDQLDEYNVYYTDDYEDDYGWKYKGIYFQLFEFKVFAGYYSYSKDLGTDPEYFNNISFNEETAKNIYFYLVFQPNNNI
jgi:hypothetical protein